MLELMDKSPNVNRFLWFIAIATVVILLVRFAPELIYAISQWQQLSSGK